MSGKVTIFFPREILVSLANRKPAVILAHVDDQSAMEDLATHEWFRNTEGNLQTQSLIDESWSQVASVV